MRGELLRVLARSEPSVDEIMSEWRQQGRTFLLPLRGCPLKKQKNNKSFSLRGDEDPLPSVCAIMLEPVFVTISCRSHLGDEVSSLWMICRFCRSLPRLPKVI